jgi:hypothetical protein
MALERVLAKHAEAAPQSSSAADAPAGLRDRSPFLVTLGLITGQLLLLLLVIRSFRVAAPAWDLMKLTAVGFLVHALLPLRYRLAFFVTLCAAAVVLVLGWLGAVQLLAVGFGIIVVCHLPIGWMARVAVLTGVGALLALGRADVLSMPVSAAVWPILGSMFMFRLIVYMYDIKHDQKLASWPAALSYFLMLPNPAFPFFPVVDYKTFRRSYYDSDATTIYQTGVVWMVRGVVHLIAYRFVYYYLTISPEEVQSSAQLARFVVANYALYLRVSGTFHLITGTLHLFGFNVPLTNNFYFLASSFTDYWRRVNIYWKDFMQKVFYYPAYFSLRRLGPTVALVMATIIVFIATTVLHSYQWFWLRGEWYLSPMDLAFWSVLGVLIIANVVWEAKRGRERTLGARKWSGAAAVMRVGKTVLTFTVIASLWSLWSAPSVSEWFAMWSVWNVGSPLTPLTGALVVSAIVILLISDYLRSAGSLGRWLVGLTPKTPLGASPYLAVSTLIVLLVAGDGRVRQAVDSTALLVLEDLQHERLNRADQGQLERGYYENLFTVEQTNPELARRYTQDSTQWVSLWQTDAVRETGDLRRLELVPSFDMLYKGQRLTTNRWGMRDRERSQVPPQGTYRFAVLGASTTMGSGVADGESYPALVEDRFAETARETPVELLNFAVESYNAIEQVAVVDQRIEEFQPHALIYIAHETEFEKTMAGLAQFVDNRTDLVYEELRQIVADAGVDPGMARTIALRRLGPHRDRVMGWAYSHIAQRARAGGILPIWVFLPMPVPGTGPCPPGTEQLFCFGNQARVGAAADVSDPRVAKLFELAHQAGFVVIDLSNVYGDTELTDLWISAADGHPSAAGHRMIADALFKAIYENPLITQDFRRVIERSGH